MKEITPQQEMNFQRGMQQEQINNDPNSVYADSMRDDKIKNVISQINPEHLLTDIEHRLRGEKKNPYTEQWEPISKDGKNLINEQLVQNYVSFLNVYITQNTSMSNFSPPEINNIMTVVISYIRDDLTDNAEKYGLTHKKYIDQEVTVKILTPFTNKDGLTYMKETKKESKQKVAIGEEYTDYDEFNRIGHMVCQSTFAVLKQAQNGNLASRIFKALRVTENLNEAGKGSKMDFLKFW
jgi:hypothetical protein